MEKFWKAYNSSRCKTAMLIITIIITVAYSISKVLQLPDDGLSEMLILVIGYWAGRTTKNKEYENKKN